MPNQESSSIDTQADDGRPAFLLSVDTEADDQWSIAGRRRRSVRNVHRLPRLQAVCDRYGVRPTYLVTYEMASEAEPVDVLSSLARTGRCEIGAHLHPWSSPPYREEDLGGTYPSQLPDDLLERQLRDLTDLIGGRFGRRPTSYRAGRYGIDGRSLRHLETLGYLVDSSVDPLLNESRWGGPNFVGAPLAPYHPDPDDLRRAGASAVLEIPIASSTHPRLPRWLTACYGALPPRRRGALKRLGLRPLYLRPSYSSARDMTMLGDRLVADGVPTLNMMFHSSELLAGASPYHHDEAAVDRFFDALEYVFDHFLGHLNACPLTYSHYVASGPRRTGTAAARGARPPQVTDDAPPTP